MVMWWNWPGVAATASVRGTAASPEDSACRSGPLRSYVRVKSFVRIWSLAAVWKESSHPADT
jgi:hypothetical protein